MGVNIIEGMQTYIQSNVELEANPVVVVVRRGGEAVLAECSIVSESG
jgi:hypothetical protein